MTDNDMPMWALDKAAKAAWFQSWASAHMSLADHSGMMQSIRAHAALIAKHEQPPVDPDLIEARECVALYWERMGDGYAAAASRRGQFDDCEAAQSVLVRLQREKEGRNG